MTGNNLVSNRKIMYKRSAKFKSTELKQCDVVDLPSKIEEIETAIIKYTNILRLLVATLQDDKSTVSDKLVCLRKINEIMEYTWKASDIYDIQLGYHFSNILRESGGLDVLLDTCDHMDRTVKLFCAQLLERSLTIANRDHVIDYNLDKIVNIAGSYIKEATATFSRIGTSLLESLCTHSENICFEVINLGGLDAILCAYHYDDTITIRQRASTLANLALYGGAASQNTMINRKVLNRLYELATNWDHCTKYYACLAFAVLLANENIAHTVRTYDCADLIKMLITSSTASEIDQSNVRYKDGYAKTWFQKLTPLLISNCEESSNMAAYAFCMEARCNKKSSRLELIREIGAIEALKTAAGSSNPIASKLAAQALRLVGESNSCERSYLWSVQEVTQWMKDIGLYSYVKKFEQLQIDGDLLFKLRRHHLQNNIGIENEIVLNRFERALMDLKCLADFSFKDKDNLNGFLLSIGPEYCAYTYALLEAGVKRCVLPQLSDEMLRNECGIANSIHRMHIMMAAKNLEGFTVNNFNTFDVLISYRQDNGEELAILLKILLQLRDLSVITDSELVKSTQQVANFVLVLTPNALDNCNENEDPLHEIIVSALTSNWNIILVLDSQFNWPDIEKIPEDMRAITRTNYVIWSSDYQSACTDKVEVFLRREGN